MATVTFEKASRIYPGTEDPAVNELDLFIEDGEFLVLVGPSGSGKSTALRMLAGLEPIDAGMVKIDGDFIRGMLDDDHRLAIVRAILDLAHTLGLEVVAEGVETKDQANRLRELGCDYAQGHLYDGPVNAEEVTARLDSGEGEGPSFGQAA